MSDLQRKLRLLLAEDSEEDEILLARHLRKSGYDPLVRRVQTAVELSEALLSTEKWDLVVSDYQMPGFSGMEALSIFKASGIDCPFLLVSGTIGEDIAVEAMRAGASDYLLKGNLARLGPAIDRELREQESRRKQRSAEERQRKLEAAIQAILVGTASAIGEDFFPALVRELARSLDMKAAFVGRIDRTDGLRIRINAIHGVDDVPIGFYYDVPGTPAEPLLRDGSLISDDIGNMEFPAHGFARSKGLNGFLGIRLDSSNGFPIGVLGVFDDKPLGDVALAKDILTIFGARAGSEFERLQSEEERNSLQEQLWHSQKLEAIGTLAGGISHDINNILSSIWGHAQILEMRKCLDGSDLQSLQGILSACRRARDLVRQILSFARKSPPETSVIHLGDIAQETVSLLKATVPPNVSIECVVDPGSPCVKADPNQMHQVLMNLCTNAWHAMEQGGMLRIEITSLLVEGVDTVRCTVSDTGSGIPDSVIGRIFEPFFTTKKQGSGTGLGLSVVHGIVRNHGGTISVRSQAGHGTTFTIDLPAVPSMFPESDGFFPTEFPTGSSQRILVIDDESAVSDVLCQLLDILGYIPVAYADPFDALKAFRENPVDWGAVITDRTMPGLSGEQLAEFLHQIRNDIPIVMSSGYEGDIRHEDLASKGIRELLPKPFQASDLAVMLRRILRA